MAKNHYFIFGRNRDTNELKCIPFTVKGISNREHSLEEIDFFTNSFMNEADFILSLYQKGLIDGYNYDMFVVVRSGSHLNTLEPIYGSYSYSRKLNKIASSKRGLDDYGESIIDDFIKKMYYEPEFYRFLAAGNSNVYKKFIDYFKKRDNLVGMLNCKYKDGSWAYKSYPLIRNMVDAINQYQSYLEHPNEFHQIHQDTIQERGNVSSQIMVLTDPDYIDGQQSIFKVEEKVDQFDYVIKNMYKIEKDTFSLDDNGYSFNTSKVSSEEDPLFIDELKRLLPQEVMELFYRFACSRYYLDHNLGYDYFEILDEFYASRLDLLKLLKNNSYLLNSAYSFLLLYNKCKSVGEENGREKRKDPS